MNWVAQTFRIVQDTELAQEAPTHGSVFRTMPLLPSLLHCILCFPFKYALFPFWVCLVVLLLEMCLVLLLSSNYALCPFSFKLFLVFLHAMPCFPRVIPCTPWNYGCVLRGKDCEHSQVWSCAFKTGSLTHSLLLLMTCLLLRNTSLSICWLHWI